MSVTHSIRWSRKGLTLIELVVVMAILAALAMLLVPRLGFFKTQADLAQSAAGAADVMNNLEQYKALTGYYPVRMDSLLEVGGTTVYSKIAQMAYPSDFLVAGELQTSEVYSLVKAMIDSSDTTTVIDHTAASSTPSDSAAITNARAITFTGMGDTAKVALINTTGTSKILAAAGYPSGVLPSNVKLVAFGVGPNNSAVGRTMATAPHHAAAEMDQYGRFIAVFAVYSDPGVFTVKAAELRTVLDSRGYSINNRISDFKKAAPTVD